MNDCPRCRAYLTWLHGDGEDTFGHRAKALEAERRIEHLTSIFGPSPYACRCILSWRLPPSKRRKYRGPRPGWVFNPKGKRTEDHSDDPEDD
jgi:hypothetical protein